MKKILVTILLLISPTLVIAQSITEVSKVDATTFREVRSISGAPITLKSKQMQCDNIQKQLDTLTAQENQCLKSLSDAKDLGVQDLPTAKPDPIQIQPVQPGTI